MKIRKLSAKKIEPKNQESLKTVCDALDEIEQILEEHFEEEEFGESHQKERSKFLGWIRTLING